MGRTSDARERLVEAGSELMHQRGYTAVGVNEVCLQAGVQKGSFYHFFPSKVELAVAVVDQFWEGAAAGRAELLNGEAAPLERLTHYAEGIRQRQFEQKKSCGQVLGCPFGNLALEMSTQEPELRDRIRETFEKNVEGFEQVVQEAMDRGDIAALDCQQAGRSILALIEGSIMLAKMNNDPNVLSYLAQDVLRLIGAEHQTTN